jgi:hypothetical protein
MASSRTHPLTTAQQLANLRTHTIISQKLAKSCSEMQELMAESSSPGAASDTKVLRARGLAWALAMLAQSSAFLASELQLTAETLAESQIECRESTFKLLLALAETSQLLLDDTARRLHDITEGNGAGYVLSSPARLDAVIHSLSELVRAIISAGFTINTKSRETTPTDAAGDTRSK